LRRSNPESFRGGILDCFARNDGASGIDNLQQLSFFAADTPSQPRGLFRPSFASSRTPSCQREQGRPGAGWHPRSTVRRLRYENLHSGIQVKPKHPAFPAQWFYGLCRVLPGERCTIAPVALRMADARTRSGSHITTRLDAQTPGVRTTRFCRTQVAPVVCATPSLTVARPAKSFAPMLPASTTAHPAFRDDRDTPL
jgi:hypothetical protein